MLWSFYGDICGEVVGYLYSHEHEELTMTLIKAFEVIAAEIKVIEAIGVKQAPLTHCEHV